MTSYLDHSNRSDVMPGTSAKTYKLLRVDENDTLSIALAHELEQYGCDIEAASTIEKTLRLSRQFEPDYILIDIKLGDENGLELIPKLRRLLPDARIIILTSFATIAIATWAIRAGADDFIIKPCDAALVFDIMTAAKPENAVSDIVSNPYDLRSLYVIDTFYNKKFNVSRTARALGLERRSLQRFLAQRKRSDHKFRQFIENRPPRPIPLKSHAGSG